MSCLRFKSNGTRQQAKKVFLHGIFSKLKDQVKFFDQLFFIVCQSVYLCVLLSFHLYISHILIFSRTTARVIQLFRQISITEKNL